MTDRPDLRDTARRFIAGAFAALQEEHVIPTPIHHPYVAVGRDYFGDTIRAVADYCELERRLDEAYPERFAEPVPRPDAEFASSYIFSFLEACVARCGRDGTFDPSADGVDKSISELLAVLDSASNEMVCCRHVGHLTYEHGRTEPEAARPDRDARRRRPARSVLEALQDRAQHPGVRPMTTPHRHWRRVCRC